jgi:hypothetical protein
VNSDALTFVLMVILAVLFLWATIELIQCFAEARRLRRGVDKLTQGVSPEESFPGNGRLDTRASAIAQKTRQPKLLAQLQPERELATITAGLSARLGRAKALSGLLIILGLLITLNNLRVAVQEMRSALEPSQTAGASASPMDSAPATGSVAPDSKVRQGIGGIAAAAGTAFGYSTIAIGLAAFVVVLSVGAQRTANSAVGSFAAWLFERHDERLLAEAEPQDTASKLAYAADTLARVAIVFEATNDALADLNLFGVQLGAAATEISGAISELPSQIDNSMAKISSDVAQGIRSRLDHQGEDLKALFAIYADHGRVLSETIKFISQIAEANKAASAALVSLGRLPADIEAVATFAATTGKAAAELTTTIQALDRKVEALPAVELSKAANHLSDAAGRIVKLGDEVAAIPETMKSAVASVVDEASRRDRAALAREVERLEAVLKTIKNDVTADTAEHSTELQATLLRLQTAIDEASRRDGAALARELERLEAVLKTIKDDVTADTAEHSTELQATLLRLQTAIDKVGSGGGSEGALRALAVQLAEVTDNVNALPSLQVIRLLGAARDLIRRS